MNNPFSSIFWGCPSNLIFSPLLIVIGLLLAYRFMKLRRIIAILALPAHSSILIKNFSIKKETIKNILLVIGSFFLFLALLHPSWTKKKTMVNQEARDLFIALDISRSMLATDCKPNRLECAKKKIELLLEKLPFDRVGLILFSGSSFVQCPLTSDYRAFKMFLDHIDVEIISSGTTALDQAIDQALQCFKATPERKNKLLVLFTDGEDFSRNLSAIKEEAKKTGMHIFTVGIGTADGAPIPLYDETGKQKGHQRNSKGAVVISRLNEGILSTLARDSGGEYIPTDKNDRDVQQLVKKILGYEKEKIQESAIEQYQEQYPYFLAVSFICFALEWIL